MARLAYLTMLAIGGVALIGLGAVSDRVLHKSASYAAGREKALLSHAAQGDFPVIMVGDSFVELADMPTLCGRRVLNAGVNGAKVADVARLAPSIIANEKPELVIVNVGVNDAHEDSMTPIADIKRDLALIARTAEAVGARVLFLGVAPLSGRGLSAGFDQGHARKINAVVRELGGRPVPVLDSDDGLHPNAAGYRVWRSVIAPNCA